MIGEALAYWMINNTYRPVAETLISIGDISINLDDQDKVIGGIKNAYDVNFSKKLWTGLVNVFEMEEYKTLQKIWGDLLCGHDHEDLDQIDNLQDKVIEEFLEFYIQIT